MVYPWKDEMKPLCRSLCSAMNDPTGTGLLFDNDLSHVKDLTMTSRLKRCNDQMMAQANIMLAKIAVGRISVAEITKRLIQRRLFISTESPKETMKTKRRLQKEPEFLKTKVSSKNLCQIFQVGKVASYIQE